MSKVRDNIKEMFSKIEEHVSTKTVVGEPVHIGDVILIPLVDVSMGVGTAMIDRTGVTDGSMQDGGGGAMGAKMTPSAVVVVSGGTVQLVNIKNQESVNKVLDMIPGILSKLNLGSIFGKKEEPEAESEINLDDIFEEINSEESL
ncbi:MAG: sporulation protein [Defluviitaleaceae bacterium]|nr:sporulation protein [Defluviitaleaceae bacterium]